MTGHTEVVIGSRTERRRGVIPAECSDTICTYTGLEFAPLRPHPALVDILDIAHALSQIVRYTGHVSAPWTVAAHSLEVSRRLDGYGPKVALAGLLHDASEAYLVDVPRPLKPHFTGYAEREARLEAVIFHRFGLDYPMPSIVKSVDTDLLLDEVANFFQPGSFIWRRYQIVGITNHPILTCLSPRVARENFLDRFNDLRRFV